MLEIDEKLRDIVKRIVEEVNPDKIILFGSRGKGKSTERSDYDIYVLKSSDVKRSELEKKIYLKFWNRSSC